MVCWRCCCCIGVWFCCCVICCGCCWCCCCCCCCTCCWFCWFCCCCIDKKFWVARNSAWSASFFRDNRWLSRFISALDASLVFNCCTTSEMASFAAAAASPVLPSVILSCMEASKFFMDSCIWLASNVLTSSRCVANLSSSSFARFLSRSCSSSIRCNLRSNACTAKLEAAALLGEPRRLLRALEGTLPLLLLLLLLLAAACMLPRNSSILSWIILGNSVFNLSFSLRNVEISFVRVVISWPLATVKTLEVPGDGAEDCMPMLSCCCRCWDEARICMGWSCWSFIIGTPSWYISNLISVLLSCSFNVSLSRMTCRDLLSCGKLMSVALTPFFNCVAK